MENLPKSSVDTINSSQKDLVFKMPVGAAKKKKKKVLDDEIYVEVSTRFCWQKLYFMLIFFQEIGKIIQRDFFPDLEKLKAQNDYLDAMERNDTIRMKELYQKYSGSKPIPTRSKIFSQKIAKHLC